ATQRARKNERYANGGRRSGFRKRDGRGDGKRKRGLNHNDESSSLKKIKGESDD
ncbi:unnamed protein product, partial [Adineta steineri]